MIHHPFDLAPLTSAFVSAVRDQIRFWESQWRSPANGTALDRPEQVASAWLDSFASTLTADRRERFEQRHRPSAFDLLESSKELLRGAP